MTYTADIARTNPTAFLFVVDQSASMDERLESGQTKAEFVADVLNKTLYQLVIRCTRSEGVRNYFDVGVIGYGGKGYIQLLGGVGFRVCSPTGGDGAKPAARRDARTPSSGNSDG